MSFTIPEKTNLLFKQSKGKPSTKDDRNFFEEPNRPARPAVIATKQIWADIIPSTAPTSLQALTDTSLDNNGNVMKGSYAGKTVGVITRYIKVPLTMVIGTENLAYEAFNANVSHPNGYADGITSTNFGTTGTFGRVLQDAIPFNFDPNGSYLFNLYKNNEIEIPFGETGGDWDVGNESGIVTFYSYENITGVNENNSPLISFYRYTGAKGLIASTSQTIFTGGADGSTGDNLASIQIDDACPTDIGQNVYTQAIQLGSNCDGSWRITIQSGGIDPTKTKFVVQKRTGDNIWTTKWTLM